MAWKDNIWFLKHLRENKSKNKWFFSVSNPKVVQGGNPPFLVVRLGKEQVFMCLPLLKYVCFQEVVESDDEDDEDENISDSQSAVKWRPAKKIISGTIREQYIMTYVEHTSMYINFFYTSLPILRQRREICIIILKICYELTRNLLKTFFDMKNSDSSYTYMNVKLCEVLEIYKLLVHWEFLK